MTEAEVQESVDYLLSSAAASAEARANRLVLEHGLKRVKALAMQPFINGGVTAAETKAYASQEYERALAGLREAILVDERHRALRDAHAARIDAWRTAEATKRSIKL